MTQTTLPDRCLALARRADVILVLGMLLLLWIFLIEREADPDLFARVAMGRLIEVGGGVPLDDPFAYTSTKDVWVDHEWLSGVVFHAVAGWGGDAALFLFKLFACLLSVATLLLARRLASERGEYHLTWLLITLATCAHLWVSTVRSQVFTYLLLPILLLLFVLSERHGRHRAILVVPLLMIGWIQFHGGFVVGLGFLSLFVFWKVVRRGPRVDLAVLCLLLTVAASFASPYEGVRYWKYILEAVAMDRPGITEWDPLGLFSWAALAPNALLVLIGIGALMRRAPRDPFVWSLLLISIYFGYRHQRLVSILMMVGYVYFADAATAPLRALFSRGGMIGATIVRGAAFAAILCIPVLLFQCGRILLRDGLVLTYRSYPVAALDWLWHNRAGGDLLVGFNQGSYALWRLHPRFRISLDGRYEEVYPRHTIDDVEEAMNPSSEHHRQALEELRPDFILLRTRYDLVRLERRFDPEWHHLYQDDRYALLGTIPNADGRIAGPGGPVDPVWLPRF